MGSGKFIRIKRFIGRGRTGLIVPIDHGLTLGPITGLETSHKIASWLDDPHIDGVVMHKGMFERLVPTGCLHDKGVLIHINGATSLSPDPNLKMMVASIERAVALGADGVSLQLNFDGVHDNQHLAQLGAITDQAAQYGLPVLTMLYDVMPQSSDTTLRMRHLIRAVTELGTDVVKIAMPATQQDAAHILDGLSEDIPIVVAGGSLQNTRTLLDHIATVCHLGAAGVCIGRNIFSRRHPQQSIALIRQVLDASTKEERTALEVH